ncbi:hypothetical protein BGX38DRAFT_1159395 [Terfezia claveryi]|nr:hypothetical protein BGX38DRAFT_1159395 [Terfezia claveryi]
MIYILNHLTYHYTLHLQLQYFSCCYYYLHILALRFSFTVGSPMCFSVGVCVCVRVPVCVGTYATMLCSTASAYIHVCCVSLRIYIYRSFSFRNLLITINLNL